MPTFPYSFLLSEIILGSGILVILILGLFKQVGYGHLKLITTLIIFGSLACALLPAKEDYHGNLLFVDPSATTLFKTIVYATALLILPIIRRDQVSKNQSEFLSLFLSLLLGASLTISANQIVLVLLSTELMAISGYVLTLYLFNQQSAEAGLKYFIYGSVGTGLMLFGFSLVYAGTSATHWNQIGHLIREGKFNSGLPTAGLIMMTGGVLFKLGAAPFHLWIPDVYSASRFSVLAIFSTLPKIAASVLLLRWFGGMAFATNQQWTMVLTIIAMVTMLAGNFPALLQNNVRRLMGYSSIAQGGFLLLAVLISNTQPFSLAFYLAAMSLSNILVFYCLNWFARSQGAIVSKDFSGLGRKHVIPSLGLTAGLLSLTGLPPLAGFSAKVFVFSGLWFAADATGSQIQFIALVFGLLNTVVALFYYIRIPRSLFLDGGTLGRTVHLSWSEKLFILSLTVVLIAFFIAPAAVHLPEFLN